MKTYRGKVVATSFLYLTVHRWIAGDVLSTWNLRWKWPTCSMISATSESDGTREQSSVFYYENSDEKFQN